MRCSRVYSAIPIQLSDSKPSLHQLDTRAGHYLHTVLRRKPGDPLIVFDGLGGEHRARIETLDRKRAIVELQEFNADNRASPLTMTLGIGLSRGERMDYAIQKATELGVSRIQPLFTNRSEVKIRPEKLEKRLQHWHGITIAACEQSGLNLVPDVRTPINVEQWCGSTSTETKLLLHPEGQAISTEQLLGFQTQHGCIIAVGPEGGFDPKEVSYFSNAEFHNLSLGPRVMRTETAPLAALSILQFVLGDL